MKTPSAKKYIMKRGWFGSYTLYIEDKAFDQKDPYDTTLCKYQRKATRHERSEFERLV